MTEAVTETTGVAARGTSRLAPGWWRRWPSWVGYAAAGWSLVYGMLGLYWAVGGGGFPFGKGDEAADGSILGSARPESVAPWIAVLGLVGAAVALVTVQAWGRGAFRRMTLGFAWVAAAGLAVVIPDARVLMTLGYAPMILFGTIPFGWPPVDLSEKVFPWANVNQLIILAGGLLWVATALAYQRRTRDACGNCGRTGAAAARWTTPVAAARWGRWAVYAAIIVPLGYALIRWAWVVHIPLGIDDAFLGELHKTGLVWAGAGLATFAVVGAILTLGLVQRWGEVFPFWIPFLRGKQVPIWFAVAPASFVTVVLFSGGLFMIREADFTKPSDLAVNPLALLPIWSVALGAATLAYYLRRRGQCRHCHRGQVRAGAVAQ